MRNRKKLKRNRRMLALLAAGISTVGISGAAWAMTIAVESGDGTVKYYTVQEIDEQDASVNSADVIYQIDQEQATAETVAMGNDQEEDKKKEKEYEEAGLVLSEDGHWTWEGEMIYILLDEDGSMTQYGDVGKEGIYLLISRNEDGSIRSVESLSGKDLLKEMAGRKCS